MNGERDPRTDPMRGDVLKRDGTLCLVLWNPRDGLVPWVDQYGARSSDAVSRFRQWASDAEVIHRGENL